MTSPSFPEPTAREAELGYEQQRRGTMVSGSARRLARAFATYREELLEPMEQLAPRLPPRDAAALRSLIAQARGQAATPPERG